MALLCYLPRLSLVSARTPRASNSTDPIAQPDVHFKKLLNAIRDDLLGKRHLCSPVDLPRTPDIRTHLCGGMQYNQSIFPISSPTDYLLVIAQYSPALHPVKQPASLGNDPPAIRHHPP